MNKSETLISSTSKDQEVCGKKNTQSMEELLSLNHNEQDLQDQQDTFEKVNWSIYTNKTKIDTVLTFAWKKVWRKKDMPKVSKSSNT